ncbi:MAG TPA: tyrosine-type recombinase/integrase [Vampirovibrionales bacterium]
MQQEETTLNIEENTFSQSSEVTNLIEEFLESIRNEKSVNTFKAYKTDLKLLEERFENLYEIKENSLRDLRLYLLETNAPKTVSRKWSSYREFLRYCQMLNLIKDNPILGIEIESNQTKKTLKKTLNINLVEALCNAPNNLRDKTLLWFMYSTGIRPSELITEGLFKNLNLAANQFKAPGRQTFLNQRCLNLLTDYLEQRKKLSGNETPGLNDHIFINEKGLPLKETHLYLLLKKTSYQVGIKANVSVLRDSLMLRLYKAGANLEEIKYLMGFKSIKSIEPLLLETSLQKNLQGS